MTGLAVTGATGRIGEVLRQQWGAGGALWLGRRALGPVRAVDLSADPAVLRGCDALIHLAGPTPGAAQSAGIHTDLAQISARACRAAGLRHLVLLSSAAVYGRARGLCREDAAAPVSDYGHEKLAMEQAAADWADPDLAITVLRLGNVAGCDALLGQDLTTPPVLDRFADGQTPQRSYIGPLTLARALRKIAARPPAPWRVINLAQPGAVAMADLLDAATIAWRARPAPANAIARVCLETSRAEALLGADLPPATPAGIVREWRGRR